jgi:hypothetical protein
VTMKDTSLKIKLTKTVRDFDGSPFAKGSVLKARIARDGMLEVVGAQHLPLYPHEWELVLTDEELKRFVERARESREDLR